jgi:hypothetical protein
LARAESSGNPGGTWFFERRVRSFFCPLRAETPERLIQESIPKHGIDGHLITGAWDASFGIGDNAPWGAEEAPLFVPWNRRMMHLQIVETNRTAVPETFTYYNIGINILPENHGCWITLAQIADAIYDAVSPEITEFGACYVNVKPFPLDVEDTDTADARVLVFDFYFDSSGVGGDDKEWRVFNLSGSSALFRQLGFAGRFTPPFWDYNGIPSPWIAYCNATTAGQAMMWSDTLPATLMIEPDDTEIPVLSDGVDAKSSGFIEIDGECVYYSGTETDYIIDGIQGYILTGCKRGYAGTVAKEIVYRYGDTEMAKPPQVQAVYCVGGNETLGANEPDRSVWISLLKTLTGCNDEATNGTYDEFPGLGIATELFDITALEKLDDQIPLAGALFGKVDDLRSWLSSCLAIEGFALVTRPLEDGTCKLTPVRVGSVGSGETITTATIDASGNVSIHGGLGSIINRLEVKGGKDVVKFFDQDSISQYGSQQSLSYSAPFADVTGNLNSLANAARRMFRISANQDFVTASLTVGTTARFIAPGDLLDLTFPNASLSGTWRVLKAQTPLRGSGKITIEAMKVDTYKTWLYSPTSEVEGISGSKIELPTGDAQWFEEGAYIWVHDPDDYSDGYSKRVDTVDTTNDELTLADVTNLSTSDVVEFDDYTNKDTEDRYLWQVDDTFTWGD